MTQFSHIAVLQQEVLKYLDPVNKSILVDATAGKGGHLHLIAKTISPPQKIFAFDRDLRAHQDDAALGVQKKFSDRIELIHQPFSKIPEVLHKKNISGIDALLCDLGVSSHQLDTAERGFSFLHDGPIDMRMDQSQGISAFDWLNNSSEKDIADCLFYLGEERKSRAIAKAIKQKWPIENSTHALASLICSAKRQKNWTKTHPATKSFQAIRMAVNSEIDEIKTLLTALPDLLNKNGCAVFISFHSGEDRLIKNFFRALEKNENNTWPNKVFKRLTKKPVTASEDELNENRRARSAKLRAIMRVQ